MDKSTSIIAALNAGKLPSTQQFDRFIEYLQQIGIIRLQERAKDATEGARDYLMAEQEPEAVQEAAQALSGQGQVLADDLRRVLNAYKNLIDNKNGMFCVSFP